MKTNYLKNIFLVGSGIAIATSTAIFANIDGVSIQANLVNLVQYLGELHITSDGTPNGDSVLSIDGNGEFSQSRSGSQLVNTASLGALGQTYPFVGAAASSGDIQVVAGVLAGMVPILANQNNDGSGMSSYIMAQSDRATLGFNADLTNQTDKVTELQVLDYGIVFRFPQGEYTFPLTAGSSGQVLTTDGSNELSWADAGGSSTDSTLFTGIFVSSNQLQNMSVNPVELLPEPGANKFIDVIDVIFKYNYGSTPYNAETLAAYFGGSPSEALFVSQYTATLDQPQDFFVRAQHASSFQNFAPDESFKLSTQSGFSPGLGDGTLEVYITYKIVDLLTP